MLHGKAGGLRERDVGKAVGNRCAVQGERGIITESDPINRVTGRPWKAYGGYHLGELRRGDYLLRHHNLYTAGKCDHGEDMAKMQDQVGVW